MFRLVTITCTLALVLSAAFAVEARTKRTIDTTPVEVVVIKKELCGKAGDFSDTVVTARDAGVSLSYAMSTIDQRSDKTLAQKKTNIFMRWIILSVYKYDAFDATRLRRMVEVACFEDAL